MSASSSSGRGRRPAAEADRTRRAVVDAALPLFARRGFDGVSVRDVAERAGTTHGLLRHHFGSKAGLWEAVVAEADRRFVARLPDLDALAAQDDPRAAVESVVAALADASRRDPEIVLLLLQESIAGGERLDHVLAHIAPLRRTTARLLARLQGAGRLTALDEAAFFLLVLGTVTLPVALDPLARAVGGGRPRRGPSVVDLLWP